MFWEFGPSGGGFSSDGAKIAGMCSKFVLGISLPAEVPSRASATWSDGTNATYAAISAADAFFAISHPATGVQAPECATVAPLTVSGAHFGTAQVKTDRGTATMSAWLFTATGMAGEVSYPALPRSAFWNDGMSNRSSGEGASVSADGRTLTFQFWGVPASAGLCGADYTAAVAESPSAVAVAVLAIPHAPPNAAIACTAMAQERSVTVNLADMLGGRVVVTASGAAVGVCPEAARSGC